MPRSFVFFFLIWVKDWFGKKSSFVWNLAPPYLWTAWKEGNCHTFEDVEASMVQLSHFSLDHYLNGLMFRDLVKCILF